MTLSTFDLTLALEHDAAARLRDEEAAAAQRAIDKSRNGGAAQASPLSVLRKAGNIAKLRSRMTGGAKQQRAPSGELGPATPAATAPAPAAKPAASPQVPPLAVATAPAQSPIESMPVESATAEQRRASESPDAEEVLKEVTE